MKLIPSFANNSKDADGTAVSPEDQLFPENRGISFPSARCSVCLSGNRIKMCMDETLRMASVRGKTSHAVSLALSFPSS
ncbi:MAG: hypothetical protein ABIZ56_07355, partial [Chthoniobacteraceae bacterium]